MKYQVNCSLRMTYVAEVEATSEEEALQIAETNATSGEYGSLDDWEYAEDNYEIL